MRFFLILSLLPFLVNATTSSPVEGRRREEKRWIWGPEIVQDGDKAPRPGSNANLFSGTTNLLTTPQAQPTAPSSPSRGSLSFDSFGSLSFNSSTTVRAPRSTKTPHARVHRQKASRQDKRYYQGTSIIQDPAPGDTASLPPIGGGHTTPDIGGLTPPTFPPRPSATPSSTQPTELTNETTSTTETPATKHLRNPILAENQRLRAIAWNSYTSRLAMESRLDQEAETSTSSSKAEETGIVWTKIRDYRDKIPGRDTLHRVVRRDARDAGALKLVKRRIVDSE